MARDRRAAILDAAFTVFAREGYARACVQDIADVAGVAKPTIYNHLTDKASLFQYAIEAAARTALAERIALLEPLHEGNVGDLRATVEAVGLNLLRQLGTEHSCSLRRLFRAEAGRCPDVVDAYGPHRLADALADRFARLALQGRLRAPDPAIAAEQFIALLSGPIETRSRLGTRPIDDSALRDIARAAADTFIRAFGTE